MCQALAAGWHHKSAEQLKEIADNVKRPRIVVVHGEADRMITVPHGRTLIEELNAGGKGGKDVIKSMIFQGQGHVIPVEKRKEMAKIIEEAVQTGEKLNDRS